jgi:hypothetical protein
MRHMVFWKDGVYISGSDVSSPFSISTKQPLISTPSLEQHRPTHTPATTPPNHSQQNTMHQSLLIALAAAATGALAGPLRRDTTSSAEYACNPAHAYPNGAQCVSTNGALSLVTPALVTPAPSSTGYACNPAHSYPNGAQCVSTAGTLSLVTPAPSSTGFACNPAHSYPEGVQCVSTNGALSLVTPTVSSSAKACKATSKATITAAASSAAASSAAQSAASAVSTKAASSGATVANGLTWTIENLSRYCASDKSGCDYNFNLTASDNRPAQACTIVRLDVKDAPTESWKDIACTANSPIKISWGYDAQFGAANAFATVVVVNEQEKAMAYFGVANINSQPVTAGNPYGSGLFGDVGPEPVYLF